MSPEQKLVDEFHEKMRLQHPGTFNITDLNGELRCSLLEEETAEFREAWTKRDPVEMIDALCDIIYVAYGAAVSMGVDLEPYFDEVHRANMSKLDKNGEPVYREDGKLQKSDQYKPPDLKAIFENDLAASRVMGLLKDLSNMRRQQVLQKVSRATTGRPIKFADQ